jgi:hypothetical protein
MGELQLIPKKRLSGSLKSEQDLFRSVLHRLMLMGKLQRSLKSII